MKQRNLALPALLASALAACKQPANDTNIAIDNGANVANAEVHTYPPNENAVASAALPTRIPQPFEGRWGLVPADCTSTKGDAKGLLTIAGNSLTFYEAKGTLAKVIAATTNSFDARYAFAGEGQTWKRTERFMLTGNQLNRRTDAEPGQEPPVNLTYARCGG